MLLTVFKSSSMMEAFADRAPTERWGGETTVGGRVGKTIDAWSFAVLDDRRSQVTAECVISTSYRTRISRTSTFTNIHFQRSLW